MENVPGRLTLEPCMEGLQPSDEEVQHFNRRGPLRHPPPAPIPTSATPQEEAGQSVLHLLGLQTPPVGLPLRRVLPGGAVVHLARSEVK